jgi:Flp pilus assembly protein TadG
MAPETAAVTLRTPSRRRRGGATVVEAALVMSVFLMFLFGIFEYCRYLLMLQVTTNAARDGARYAVVNVDKPSTFDETDYIDGTRTYVSIKSFVNTKMANVTRQIDGYTVSVFPCDMAQLLLTPPVVAPKAGYTRWNEAQFSDRIAVRITGTYTPFLPNLLQMNSSIPVNIAVTMSSEG